MRFQRQLYLLLEVHHANKSAFLSIVLLALRTSTPGTLRSQNAPPSPSEAEHAKRSLAVNFMRAIGTAEAQYRTRHGAYASRDVLLASEEFKGRGWTWAAKNDPQFVSLFSGLGIPPGSLLRLNVTADGKAYDVLLEDTTDQSCGYAVVSDERGMIRESKAIGCAI
jgi:hypothetical protein